MYKPTTMLYCKKMLLLIVLCATTVCSAFAQGTTCDTINMPVPGNWSGITYNAPDPFGFTSGYINGTNWLNDLHKANYFDLTGTSFSFLLGTIVKFGKANTATAENLSKPILFKVYAADGTGSRPGTLLGTAQKTLEQVRTDVNAGAMTQVNFPSAIPIPANKKFYISVDISNFRWPYSGTKKDSIWIAGTADDQTTNTAWEFSKDSTWDRYPDNWSNPNDQTNDLNVSLWIFPYVSNVAAGCTLLPVKLLSFNANRSNADVTLKWEVSEEYNMQGYTIEKSNNTGSFTPIATVPAVNAFKNQSYTVTDRNAFSTATTVQYRLKQTDGDGSVTYSRIIAVKGTSSLADVHFANPFTGALQLQLQFAAAQTATIKLYDMQGRLLHAQQPMQYQAGSNNVIIPSTARLQNGTYLLQISMGSEHKVFKVIKQ